MSCVREIKKRGYLWPKHWIRFPTTLLHHRHKKKVFH